MQNQLMVAIFVAMGATLVAGLIAIPVLEQSVLAKGPPEKAQIILGTEPKQRGNVASEGKCSVSSPPSPC
jgi:hypothetical protein